MSNNNMWGEEDPFQDMPEEAQTIKGQPGIRDYVPPPPPPQPSPGQRQKAIERSNAAIEKLNSRPETVPEPTYEAQDVVQDEEDLADAEVLSDANLRLEQGSLYKMIMKHDLFAGVDADPKAVQNVQRAIRKFAREQMEIMLGMRRESAVVERLEIDFPFNALEVEVIRAMAKTFSKGATEESDRYVPEVRTVKEEVPVVVREKRTTLNPINGNAQKTTAKALPKAAAKPIATRPAAPAKRTALDEEIDRICAEEGISRELLEENKLLTKPINQLTDQEKLERNNAIAKRRGTQVKSSTALPMPDAATAEMLIVSRMPNAETSSNPLFRKLVDAVKAMPMKDPYRERS